MIRRLSVALIAGAVALGTLSSCVPGTPSPSSSRTEQGTGAAKHGDGTVKTNLDSITNRVPGLAGATAVSWTGGTTGDDRAPGPTTYWIDAVLDVPAETLSELRTTFETKPVDAPDLAPALEGVLPEGPFESSFELDKSLSSGDWQVQAYLAPDSNQLVVLILGGH